MRGRDSDIVYHLSMGVTVKQIARILALSPRTVEGLIRELRRKHNCINTHHLIGTFFRKNIIE